MTTNQDIDGWVVDDDHPTWELLEPLMDDELVASFMWMFEIELATGEHVHAFKHRVTRRYLYLDTDGNPWGYVEGDPSRYRRMPSLAAMLELVLSPWWERLRHDEADIAMARAAIERARRRETRGP